MTTTITNGSQTLEVTAIEYSATRAVRTIVHPVIGRADPSITLHPLATRTGQVDFLCGTRDEALAVFNLHTDSLVMQLQDLDAPDVDMYYVITGELEMFRDSTKSEYWRVRVEWTEVLP